MNVELSSDDLALIRRLVDKEEGWTRVEIHHSKNQQYKECLKEREQQVRGLLGRLPEVKEE